MHNVQRLELHSFINLCSDMWCRPFTVLTNKSVPAIRTRNQWCSSGTWKWWLSLAATTLHRMPWLSLSPRTRHTISRLPVGLKTHCTMPQLPLAPVTYHTMPHVLTFKHKPHPTSVPYILFIYPPNYSNNMNTRYDNNKLLTTHQDLQRDPELYFQDLECWHYEGSMDLAHGIAEIHPSHLASLMFGIQTDCLR